MIIIETYGQKIWRCEATGTDGNVTLFGVNIFDYEWNGTGRRVTVRDPHYGQEYKFQVYTVTINGQTYEFAAGEFSMCIWGFYVERY